MPSLRYLKGALAPTTSSTVAGEVMLKQIKSVTTGQEAYVWTESDCHGFSQRREITASYVASAASVMYFHTETLNIWSHLLGTVWFFSSLVHFVATHGGPTTSADAVAVWVYLTATTLCFANSTLYHLFANHTNAGLWQLADHIGIIGSIWSSSISFTILSSSTPSDERWIFVTLLSAAAATSLHRLLRIRSHNPCARQMRISIHIALGALAAIPALRVWLQRSQDQQVELLADFAWLFLLNGAGGSIYASHVLDKTVGMDIGMPDLSHHVMHVLVILGASIYKQGILSLYCKRAV
jgi:adiponectin receptor